MRSGKVPLVERHESSGRPRPLSNFPTGLIDRCLGNGLALLPQACLLCGAGDAGGPLCGPCRTDLPWLPARRCGVCALPLASGRVCGACLDRPPHFTRVEAALAYRFPADALIHAYKYRGRLALARALAEALAPRVGRDVDALIPMPLAPGRLAERGFNQALEIARRLGRTTGIRVLARACRKVVDTPPQAALPWQARARNVRRAFVCDDNLAGLRVAVVDDVLTTGATLNELARVLRKAGAVEVHGWVVARTLPR